ADPEVLNRVFRSAHTLKGNSAMLGLDDIARFTHVLESLLARLRRGELVATRRIIDTMLASADVLRDLLRQAQAEDGSEVSWYEETLAALQGFADGGREAAPRVVRVARPAETSGSVFSYEIRFTPPPDMLRRGLDPVRLLGALEELGQLVRVESDPRVLP